MVHQLAKHPASQSGHFSRHFDRVVGVDMSGAGSYHVDVPMQRKADASRSVVPIPVTLPHEFLAEEVEHVGADAMKGKLQRAIESNELPPPAISRTRLFRRWQREHLFSPWSSM